MAAGRDWDRGRFGNTWAFGTAARFRGTVHQCRPGRRSTRCRHRVAGDAVNTPRRYPRTARVSEVMLEVLAEELERLSDPRLELVTLTGVDVNRDITKATVYYSTLGDIGVATDAGRAGHGEGDAAAALESATPHLRAVLGREVRVKHVPRLVFMPDPAVQTGRRIEEILRDIHAREDA